jgi:hypothetical protein
MKTSVILASTRLDSRALRPWAVAALILLWGGSAAEAQFFSECWDGSVKEFERSIAAHEEHNYRLYHKFHADYYYQGELSKDFEGGSLEDVRRFIAELAPRSAGVLFYGLNKEANRLCSWLVGSSGNVYFQATNVTSQEFSSSIRGLVQGQNARGVVAVEGPKTPDPGVWSRVGKMLLPPRIEAGLLSEHVETLIVVPVFAVGAVPYAALPFGGGQLVDRMSVVVAPGFFVFLEPPPSTRKNWPGAIVVGDPESADQSFDPLKGARQEALAVAKLLGVQALIGAGATSTAVRHAIDSRPDTSLVYVATHGVADGDNPRDDSFLLLSDGRWPARALGELKLTERPLVVLSACQTGLGKDFDVGTIGMARAWQNIGASQVVMSLWNVNDDVTGRLMVRFVESIAAGRPVDKALQAAMRETRDADSEKPADWAGFTLFGVPTR